jgi:hypothetical protein
MITILEHGPSFSVDQLNALETAFGSKLDGAYRTFLLENNGGRPEPNVVDVPGLPGTPTDVQVFFGIGRKIYTSNLELRISSMTERCPGERLFPIAQDSFGNSFCLRAQNEIAKEVVYVCFDESGFIVHHVSDSFNRFLEGFRTLRLT